MTTSILVGDCRQILPTLPDESVQCCVTSPPYWGLRDYGHADQIGHEKTPDLYVEQIVAVMREVRRVLKKDGTLWLNLGDSYTDGGRGKDAVTRSTLEGARHNQTESRKVKIRENSATKLRPKNLLMIPARVALALQADDWYLRSDIIWAKPNGMPESVTDRPTRSHEYIFLLSKKERYYYDHIAIREPLKEGSLLRLNQDVDGQQGSDRPFKAQGKVLPETQAKLGEKRDKQRGHSRRHDGFNDRWDHMTREEQMAGGANKRDVWTVATHPFKDAHFATFPPKLIEPCIKAGTKPGDIVLDPFGGAATTGLVADRLGRDSILIELNPAYAAMGDRRINSEAPLFTGAVNG